MTFGVDNDDESHKSQTNATKKVHPMPELSSEAFSMGYNERETSAATTNYLTHRVYTRGPVLNDGPQKSQEVAIRQSLQHAKLPTGQENKFRKTDPRRRPPLANNDILFEENTS